MNDYEIIDAHVHVNRNITQEKDNLPVHGRRDRDCWGNPESINAYLDHVGISKVVSLNLLPSGPMRRALLARIPANLSGKELEAAKADVEKELARRLKGMNEWLCQVSKENPRIVASIGIQKLLTPEEMVKEVELRVAQGAKAVKLIPGMFQYYPSDHDFWPMYEKCQQLGIPVTSDTGSSGGPGHTFIGSTGVYYGEPINFTEVLESFPRLTLVMCHLPSAFWDERVEMAHRYPNLYFDSSGGFNAPYIRARDGIRAVAEEDAVRIIRKIGADRIMWGTDGPGALAQPGIEQIFRLDLTEEEKRLILAENAKRIYKI